MSQFRTSHQLLTESSGAYVSGTWVAGSRTSGTFLASVQPVMVGQDMQALPEGRHMSDFVKVYTDDRLKVTADGEGVQPDIVVFQGYGYELVSMFQYQSNVISHYKYIGVKVFKFTNTSDWTSGVLQRAQQ
jgi:hypothetical protein